MIQKLLEMLKLLEMCVKGHGQGHKVIDLGAIGKVSLVEYACSL